MKRLYEVTCSFTYYAYTEGSSAAIFCAEEAARDVLTDTATVQVVKYRDHCLSDGWDGTSLVYGTEEVMELRDALKGLPERGGT